MAGFGTSKILTQFRPLTCAAATACHSGRLAAHPPDLIKWVRREGGFVHQSVRIAPSADSCGLGLVASQDIPKGSELITLPHHIPLRFSPLESEDVDAVDPVLANLARQVPEELWAMRLGLKLLQERAAIGSFWWPYISNLPETYSVPIFFPGEDIKNLQYAPLLYQGAAVSFLPNMEQNPSKLCLAYEQFFNFSNHNKFPGFAPVVGFPWVDQLKCILFDTHYAEVNKRCRFLLDFEKEVKCVMENLKPEDHPFRGQDVNASSLGWAMSAVSSRAFRLHGKKLADGTHVDVPMMLPLIDMCNHSFNPNAHIVQEQDAGSTKMLIKVVAETEIKQDDNLLLNYGCLNNDFFLLDYGFVIPSNPYDSIELKYDGALLDAASMAAGVTSPNFSSPAPWQQRILSQLNLDGEAPVLKVSLGGSELVEGRLLAALRVLLAADPETVQKHDLGTLKLLAAEAPIGISNEMAALRTVIALCVIALGHFPTKIMEDEALLKQGASVSAELAIQFRIQKKSVIIDVMRSLTRRVKLLSSKEKISAQG